MLDWPAERAMTRMHGIGTGVLLEARVGRLLIRPQVQSGAQIRSGPALGGLAGAGRPKQADVRSGWPSSKLTKC